jgi:hypothetical protein
MMPVDGCTAICFIQKGEPSPGPFRLQLPWTCLVLLDFCFSATDLWLTRVEKYTLRNRHYVTLYLLF